MSRDRREFSNGSHSLTDNIGESGPAKPGHAKCGAIAQLGERLPRTEEVGGSNPLRSTSDLLSSFSAPPTSSGAV